MPTIPLNILIVGAGITGLATAIALHKSLADTKPRITIVEIRPAPSTIGGAVNLTPKALRYLNHLGVLEILLADGAGAECKTIELFDLYTGKRSGEVDFRGQDGTGIGKGEAKKYFAMRTMRWQLQKALLQVVQKQESCSVHFGRKISKFEESAEGVRIGLEDGSELIGDLLLGCDGIHSCVRQLLIDSERKTTYTGIATSTATSKVQDQAQLRWQTTALISSRKGSFMASYFENSRQLQYIAVVVETDEVNSREGWKIRGSDQDVIKRQILVRFDDEAMPELKQLVEDAGDWTLYPVYQLPPGGTWTSAGGRCILLGDAAHAMPPQGESTGMCIEDAIAFGRAMMNHETSSLLSICRAYEKIRRPIVDAAYRTAVQRWENVRDKGWLAHQLMLWLTPWLLWWTSKSREDDFLADLSGLEVQIEN